MWNEVSNSSKLSWLHDSDFIVKEIPLINTSLQGWKGNAIYEV